MAISYLDGNDAVFLPGKIHGTQWQAYIIYFSPEFNDGKGSFEIEIVDCYRVLQLFAEAHGDSNYFFETLPDVYQGEWYYTNAGEESFNEYVSRYSDADFIVGKDGEAHEEMMFLVNWAVKTIEKEGGNRQ